MRASTRCARFTPKRHTAQAASSGAGRPRSYLRVGEGEGGEEKKMLGMGYATIGAGPV